MSAPGRSWGAQFPPSPPRAPKASTISWSSSSPCWWSSSNDGDLDRKPPPIRPREEVCRFGLHFDRHVFIAFVMLLRAGADADLRAVAQPRIDVSIIAQVFGVDHRRGERVGSRAAPELQRVRANPEHQVAVGRSGQAGQGKTARALEPERRALAFDLDQR